MRATSMRNQVVRYGACTVHVVTRTIEFVRDSLYRAFDLSWECISIDINTAKRTSSCM